MKRIRRICIVSLLIFFLLTGCSGDGSDRPSLAPVPGGSGTLTQTDSFNNNIAFKWDAASDVVTPQNELQYRVYYSTLPNIDNVEEMEANGTAVGDWTEDIACKAATALTPLTGYYFNVLVKNNAGVKAAYKMKDATTDDMPMSVTNGSVHALGVEENIVYLGGAFTLVGKPITGGTILDASDGSVPANTLPGNISGTINVSVPDGRGGWYIGGLFTRVNGIERRNVAHISADGVLYDWDPKADSVVSTIAVRGDTVYVGGLFKTIGGKPRQSIAAIDATTGKATDWAPDPSGTSVSAIAVIGDTVYVGGRFKTIGGKPRQSIAAIDATTGEATDWDPNPNDDIAVFTITVIGNTVYVGGVFKTIGDKPRQSIAAINATTGNVTDWDPKADGPFHSCIFSSIALSANGKLVYAGGQFETIGGEPRSNIAAIDATTGKATDWDPDANWEVKSIALSGDGKKVYVAGYFFIIGGQSRNKIAALDATTGEATDWNPNAGGDVETVAVSSSTVYMGGQFMTIGGLTRSNIAAIDATTGNVTDWDPNADVSPGDPCVVSSIALSTDGKLVYAGGLFETIGGEPRSNITAIDATTGEATDWNPSADGEVFTIAVGGRTVYVGGHFKTIGGKPRYHIADLDAMTGEATDWDPNADVPPDDPCEISSIALSANGKLVYVGGRFDTIGGKPRNHIAALDVTTGEATDWDPSADSYLDSIVLSGDSTVFVAGHFEFIGGVSRNYVAALDATTGEATDWDPSADSTVGRIVLSADGKLVYAVGVFETIGGEPRHYIAALDATTGKATDWNPSADGLVSTIAVSGDTVYMGGSFLTIGGQSRTSFAAVDANTGEAR